MSCRFVSCQGCRASGYTGEPEAVLPASSCTRESSCTKRNKVIRRVGHAHMSVSQSSREFMVAAPTCERVPMRAGVMCGGCTYTVCACTHEQVWNLEAAPTCERAPVSRCDMWPILTTRLAGCSSRLPRSISANESASRLGQWAAPYSPLLSEADISAAAMWQARVFIRDLGVSHP